MTVTRLSKWVGAVLIAMAPLCHAAAPALHNPLLPEPREIRYGAGYMPLGNAAVCVAPGATAEDRFAARLLAEEAGKRAGARLVVRESKTCPGGILLRRTGPVDALPAPGEKPGPEGREAYTIHVARTGAEVAGRSSAAVFYGVQTLLQMMEPRNGGAALPECDVRDWPALAYRAFMMDMSHAQLPKVEEVKKQLDFLARWKTNQYYFYSEASIELEGYPLLMAEARFTQAQVKEIVAYARQRHIDVVPNLELYGHLHDLFRLERYSRLAVLPHGGEFNRSDARVQPLIDGWVRQIAGLFPSPFFHIGFDETWLLRNEATKMGVAPETLYLGQLRHVAEAVQKLGKTPLAWADMMQQFPQIVPDLPKGLIMVPWHYHPLPEKEYDRLLGPFAKGGVPMIVQPAAINWNWLLPDYDTSFRNTDLLLAAGAKYGATGSIMSGWTDDTQVLMRLVRPVMAYGSVAAWQAQPVNRETFFSRYASVVYSKRISARMAAALEAVTKAETLLQKVVDSTGQSGTIRMFWANPFTPEWLRKSEANRETLSQCRLAAEDAQEAILEALRAGEDRTTLNAMLVGARLVDYAAMKHLYAAEIAGFWRQLGPRPARRDVWTLLSQETASKYHSRTADMMDAIAALRESFREAWLAEYTPFRLGVAMAKYDAEFQYWWKLQWRIQDGVRGFRDGDELPPLERVVGKVE